MDAIENEVLMEAFVNSNNSEEKNSGRNTNGKRSRKTKRDN